VPEIERETLVKILRRDILEPVPLVVGGVVEKNLDVPCARDEVRDDGINRRDVAQVRPVEASAL
jgi:hypothetical protein